MINTYRIIKAYLLKRADEEHLLPEAEQRKVLRDLSREQSAPGGLLDSLKKKIYDVPHSEFTTVFGKFIDNLVKETARTLQEAKGLKEVGDILWGTKQEAMTQGLTRQKTIEDSGRQPAYYAEHPADGPQGYLRDPEGLGGKEDTEALVKTFFYHLCHKYPYLALVILHDNRLDGVLDTPTLHSFIDKAVEDLKSTPRSYMPGSKVTPQQWITQLSHFFPNKVPMDYIDHPLTAPTSLIRNLVNNKNMSRDTVKRVIDNAIKVNNGFNFDALLLAQETEIYPQSQIDQIVKDYLDKNFSIDYLHYAIALKVYTRQEVSALIRERAERRPILLIEAALQKLITKADAEALVKSLKGKIKDWDALNDFVQEAQLT